MPEDESWADECIKKARESHPAVNESVLNRVRELLIGKRCERPMRAPELASAAKALIIDMGPASTPKVAGHHED